jgi:hypothetical protein
VTEPDKTPEEPLSALVQGAVQVHEMFETYVRVGFSRQEALELVARIITAGIRPPEQT